MKEDVQEKKLECPRCKSTGIVQKDYKPSIGLLCSNCKGRGWVTIDYKEFKGQEECLDVEFVIGCDMTLAFVLSKGKKVGLNKVSYQDFLDGKMPSLETRDIKAL